jgi:HEAT repeat protein
MTSSRGEFKRAFLDVEEAFRAGDVPKLLAFLKEPAGAAAPGLTIRGVAARRLGKLRALVAVDGLLPLVSDHDFDVRIAAIDSLARIADGRAANVLVDRLGSAEHPAEIVALLRAIASTGGLSTDNPVVHRLAKIPNRRVRNALEDATGRSARSLLAGRGQDVSTDSEQRQH